MSIRTNPHLKDLIREADPNKRHNLGKRIPRAWDENQRGDTSLEKGLHTEAEFTETWTQRKARRARERDYREENGHDTEG